MMDRQPVVGIALFQVLLLALSFTGPILSPVFCLTPGLHYYLAPAQEYAVTGSYREDSPALILKLFIGSATPA